MSKTYLKSDHFNGGGSRGRIWLSTNLGKIGRGVPHMTDLKPNLIYDVGLHRGEDTEFYLKKGFNVVAFEANPELVAQCKIHFQDAITSGRLRIIEGAIAPQSVGERVTFYRNPSISVWGTVEKAWAERNARLGHSSEEIELPRVEITEVYRALGIPFYLKIDVEGIDSLVLKGLKQFEARPRYISIESEKVDFVKLQAEMASLRDLGYKRFKVVEQSAVPGTTIRTSTLDGREVEHVFEPNASGPFGEEILQPWLSCEDTLRKYESIFKLYQWFGDNSFYIKLPKHIRIVIRMLYRMSTGYRGALPGWYDTHASL
jgi:FkbM family methyltransferase